MYSIKAKNAKKTNIKREFPACCTASKNASFPDVINNDNYRLSLAN